MGRGEGGRGGGVLVKSLVFRVFLPSCPFCFQIQSQYFIQSKMAQSGRRRGVNEYAGIFS